MTYQKTTTKVQLFGLPLDPSKLIQTSFGVRSYENLANPTDYAGMSANERREIALAVIQSWAEWGGIR